MVFIGKPVAGAMAGAELYWYWLDGWTRPNTARVGRKRNDGLTGLSYLSGLSLLSNSDIEFPGKNSFRQRVAQLPKDTQI